MTEQGAKKLLDAALAERKARVMSYIFSRPEIAEFEPEHLREASLQYLRLGGKSLRPGLVLFSCGAVGGNEALALPAAAAVEVYHTWTLVHDDVIDRDAKRRGKPSVHEEFRRRAEAELGYSAAEAAHYGVSMAILAGDMLQGWCTSLLGNLSLEPSRDPRLVLKLIDDLMLVTQARLVAGQVLDVQFEQVPVESLSEADILKVLAGKTAALLEYCGQAGALIGLNSTSGEEPQVRALSSFTRLCGLAFQLQDDVLGIVGNEELLGKPIGSDIREGKKTLIMLNALQHANSTQRATILTALGNKAASLSEIQRAIATLEDLGSIRYVQDKANAYVTQAIGFLAVIPPSPFKDLLLAWAGFMVDRNY